MASPASVTPGRSTNGGGGGASSSSGGGGGGGNPRPNKPEPELAQGIDASLHTRQIPPPLPEGAAGSMSNGARQAAEDEDKEDQCPICLADLPDMGRGVLTCGHVFCFTCVYEWVKTSAKCPTCRVEFKKITKTLTPVEIAKEGGRIERKKIKAEKDMQLFDKKPNNKNNTKKKKKKKLRVKTPVPGVMVKTVRIRNMKDKQSTNPIAAQYVYDFRRREEEQRQRQQQQAQARLAEVAAEARLKADKAREEARALRGRALRSVREEITRVAAAAEEDARYFRRAMEAEAEARHAKGQGSS